MNGFLLDTNVVSELRKRERCAPKVSAWASTVPPNQDFLSVLVVGELRRGATLKRQESGGSGCAGKMDRAASPTIQRPHLGNHAGNRLRVGTAQRVAPDSTGRWLARSDRTGSSANVRDA
ncbi:MAG: hypothetical protein DME60_00030 [Verrucomicrobia bacterium]|nr:MAG: hypothetical protein DME60_00030 [Verrucomicrobiota bacterium]